MSRYARPIFNPSRPLFARKTFVANGHTLEPDAPFMWKRMAVSQRKVSTLFANGYLKHAEETDETEAKTIEQELQDEDIHDAALDASVEDAPQTAPEPQADDTADPANADADSDPDSVDGIDDRAALQDLARGSGRKKITKNARAKLISLGQAW